MNQRQFASVLFAAVGLLLSIMLLPTLLVQVSALATWEPSRLDPATPFGQRITLILGLLSTLVTILLAVALVLWRERIAARLFPSASGPLDVRGAQAAAFAVLGAYFIVQGLRGLVEFGFIRWSGVVQLVLGLALFFGAGGIAAFWAQLQERKASAARPLTSRD